MKITEKNYNLFGFLNNQNKSGIKGPTVHSMVHLKAELIDQLDKNFGKK